MHECGPALVGAVLSSLALRLGPWRRIQDSTQIEFAPSAAKLSKVLQLSALPLSSMSMDG